MATRCPSCHADADGTLTRKDGTLRAHRRPTPIKGGVAAAECAGAGQRPEPTPTPSWVAAAYAATIGD